MSKYLEQLFSDKLIVGKVQQKMPYMFQLVELENSRAGKLGMEIGSARERIIIALLIYKFGEENINPHIPITKTETDVELFGDPISIKTISGDLSGVKLIWTVDTSKALEFSKAYSPSADMLLTQINWGGKGKFYYIPKDSQVRVLKKMGRNNYIKLPKIGTNPRGVEISKDALEILTKDSKVMCIEIEWKRGEVNHGVYDRWIELWRENTHVE